MPGQQIKKAREIGRVEELALEVAFRVFSAMPTMYRKRAKSDPSALANDALGQMWVRASGASLWANIEIERLGEMLRVKARLPKVGPTAECLKDGEDSSGE